MRSFIVSAAALLSALPAALAQTHTACNALNTTGCPNMPALGGNATFTFNDTLYPKVWTKKNQGDAVWGTKGAVLTVARSGDSPQLTSNFYMLFGRFEAVLKTAPGRGIISSAILQSEVLDEIDWEWMGGNTTHTFTNYYGKGNTTVGNRGADFPMANPQEDFHNYTLDWTKERTQWWLDGKMVRQLNFGDALPGGKNYPQTPMNIRIGVWSGGDAKNNHPDTVTWAGGPTDFSQGPFSMVLQSVYAKDYTSAKEYSWEGMDASGSWEKVKVIEGKSPVLQEIEKPSGVKNRWKALSKTAQIAIIASIAGFVVIIFCLIVFCCIRQRRAGRREFAANQAMEDKEAAELLQFKAQQSSNGKFGYNRI